MKYGPLVFLAAFFALSASWCGFVLAPQLQIGRGEQNVASTGDLYPLAPPGVARQGLEVYRANGCVYCHSQQVRQTGIQCDLILKDVGTNPVAVAEALVNSRAVTNHVSGPGLAAGLPKAILRGASIELATRVAAALKATGAKVAVDILPQGPDIARNWGKRRSVARDFLFDDPVMPGSLRVGPDLANVGSRWPESWQFIHLYAPRAVVEKSPMPPYRYLFEVRKIAGQPSPDALQLPEKFAPPAGHEVVPKPETRALVAYLRNLQANTPLFEAPMSAPPAPPSATNNASVK